MILQKDFSEVLTHPVFEVLQKAVAESNEKSYITGGFVRDHLLNRSQKKDIDVVALGSGIDLAKTVQKKLDGAKAVQIFKTYGTAKVHWKGIDIEFVGARKDSYSTESKNPNVEPGT